jgi:hypothetical protein
MARRNNDDLRVLGMTATPVINDLDEGKSLLEIVTGKRYDDLDTTPIIANGFATHQKLLLCSTRQIPEYKTGYGLHPINIDVEQPEDISIKSLKRNPMMLEQFLVRGKIPEILDCIDKEGHTLIYTEYVTGVVNQILKAVRDAGYSCGLCIGENKSGLQPFKDGKLDVLVASHPAAVAVDGLQEVCSSLIISSLPWTNAQFQQLVGRIFREGQKKKVEIYVIRATITKMINGKMYRFPYDPVLKWDRIQSKKTMADCATDGIFPTANLLSWKAARLEAIKWIERLEKGEMSTVERRDFAVELPEDIEEIQEKERRVRKFGDISLMHQLWNREKSTTTHQRILEDPTFLLNYHDQLKEDEKKKSVIPRHIIANRIREMQRPRYMKRLIIADFGSGPAELSKLLPSNRVYSFDHSKVLGDSIIECDMSHTSLKDNGIDVAVFSLSLMGLNWIDYIKEARRVLTDQGHILIATTNRELDEHGTLYKEEKGRLYELRQILQREGFEINTDRSLGEFNFIYAMKR